MSLSKTRKTPSSKDKQSNVSDEMKGREFHKFFIDELKDIYWAEKQLVKALPKMKKASTNEELGAAFEKHKIESENHVSMLQHVFELLDEKAIGRKCEAMEGLLMEAGEIINDTESDTAVRDAGLILAAQKVEHYEIATYGTLRAFAMCMKHKEVAQLLEQILEEEKNTDVALTEIAESFVNEQALME